MRAKRSVTSHWDGLGGERRQRWRTKRERHLVSELCCVHMLITNWIEVCSTGAVICIPPLQPIMSSLKTMLPPLFLGDSLSLPEIEVLQVNKSETNSMPCKRVRPTLQIRYVPRRLWMQSMQLCYMSQKSVVPRLPQGPQGMHIWNGCICWISGGAAWTGEGSVGQVVR